VSARRQRHSVKVKTSEQKSDTYDGRVSGIVISNVRRHARAPSPLLLEKVLGNRRKPASWMTVARGATPDVDGHNRCIASNGSPSQ